MIRKISTNGEFLVANDDGVFIVRRVCLCPARLMAPRAERCPGCQLGDIPISEGDRS